MNTGLLRPPTPCSELSPVDHLWRELKRRIAANRQFRAIGAEAEYAERGFPGLTARQAPRKAGTVANDFWPNALL